MEIETRCDTPPFTMEDKKIKTDTGTATPSPAKDGTQRHLEARHIQMIAIGGTSKLPFTNQKSEPVFFLILLKLSLFLEQLVH